MTESAASVLFSVRQIDFFSSSGHFTRTIRCIHALCAAHPCLQDWRKLGKHHVRKLLKAVRRDCLQGMTTTEQKVSLFCL